MWDNVQRLDPLDLFETLIVRNFFPKQPKVPNYRKALNNMSLSDREFRQRLVCAIAANAGFQGFHVPTSDPIEIANIIWAAARIIAAAEPNELYQTKAIDCPVCRLVSRAGKDRPFCPQCGARLVATLDECQPQAPGE